MTETNMMYYSLPNGACMPVIVHNGEYDGFFTIPGFEDYQITIDGRIRSKTRKVKSPRGFKTCHSQMLMPKTNTHGYNEVTLICKGVKRYLTVHGLVMLTFVGERPKDFDIDHINRIRTDNRLENLEYVTKSENQRRWMKTKNVGISWNKACSKWDVRFSKSGKKHYLGRYVDLEEAIRVRNKAFLENGIIIE